MQAVLQGKRFVSAGVASHNPTNPNDDEPAGGRPRQQIVAAMPLPNVEVSRHHEVGFYSDDRYLLDDLTQFTGAALQRGNAAIVVATELHRNSLLPRLQTYGLDVAAVIEQGRYVALDALDTLSAVMLRGMPDPVRLLKLLGDLVVIATKATKGQRRVAIFGECVHLLWIQGNAKAAIQFERLGNELAKTHEVDILCGYSLGGVRGGMDSQIFQRICAEHSAVHSR